MLTAAAGVYVFHSGNPMNFVRDGENQMVFRFIGEHLLSNEETDPKCYQTGILKPI